MNVTILTENATHDDLTEETYLEIYSELRRFDLPPKERISLDKFCAMIGSKSQKMTWNRYEKGEGKLSRAMKNELRAAVGKTPLPPTLGEIMETLDPNLRVTKLGTNEPSEIFLADESSAKLLVETPKNHTAKKRIRLRTTVYPEQNEKRLALKVSWQEVINAGLQAIQEQELLSIRIGYG